MVYKVLLSIVIGRDGFDKNERQDDLLPVESLAGNYFWNEYLICWISVTFTWFSWWSKLGLRFKAISFTSCRAINDGKTCGIFVDGKIARAFIDGKIFGASINGKNWRILVGGKWLTFNGKTWKATNDGRTCGAPIGGRKLMFDGKAWGTTNDGKTCGNTVDDRAWGSTNDGKSYGSTSTFDNKACKTAVDDKT